MSKTRKKGKNRASRRARKKNQKGAIWMAILGVGIVLVSLAIWISLRDNTTPTPAEVVDATPEVKGGPSLKVDKEIIDFGNLKLGEEVTAEFQLTNVGDKLLRFSGLPFIELKAGC